MHIVKKIVAGSVLAFTAAVGGVQVQAQAPGGQHPTYLVVLSDLRYAYGLLDKRSSKQSVDEAQGTAKSEIMQAIDSVKKLAVDDHKPLSSHPNIDASLTDADRFKKAQEVLQQAHHDIDAAEEVAHAPGLKGSAINHITEAYKEAGRAESEARK